MLNQNHRYQRSFLGQWRILSICILTIYLIDSEIAQTQTRADHWYFGEYLGIHFDSNGVQEISNGAAKNHECVTAMSEKTGELYFYSGIWTGGTGQLTALWNKNHQIMPNGDDLYAHSSSSQGIVACPNPADTNEHFIFCLDRPLGGTVTSLYYSILDHELDGGLGDIKESSKNIFLKDWLAEKMAIARKSDSSGYWLITHQNPGTEVYVFEIDSTGINTTPQVFNGIFAAQANNGGSGFMKVSPDGKKLAMCQRDAGGEVEIFEFDPSTGVVSEPILLPVINFGGSIPYGIEFSTDSKILYLIDPSGMNYQGALFQWDVSVHDSATIASTEVILNDSMFFHGGMQMGPDSMIYMTSDSGLHRIKFPNQTGLACGLEFNFMTFDAQTSVALPYFPTFMNEKFLAPQKDTTDTTDSTSIVDPIESQNQGLSIEISPNPVKDLHQIRIYGDGDFQLNLMNYSGALISTIAEGKVNIEIQLNYSVSDLPNGIYFYHLRFKYGEQKSSFVKM